MYFKFEDRQGKRVTFFSAERIVNGEKITHTDKSVFGTLSEGIKTGENNGKPIYENDYWNVMFCGKAYEKALKLENKTRIVLVEFNIRNQYYKRSKKTYPQIMVTDFDIMETEISNTGNEFVDIPDGIDIEMPFN